MLQDADGCTALHKASQQVSLLLQGVWPVATLTHQQGQELPMIKNPCPSPQGHGGQFAEIWNEAM